MGMTKPVLVVTSQSGDRFATFCTVEAVEYREKLRPE